VQTRDGFGKTYCEYAQGDVIGRVCAPCPLIVAQRRQAHKGHCPGQKPDPWVLVHSPLHNAQRGENRSQCMIDLWAALAPDSSADGTNACAARAGEEGREEFKLSHRASIPSPCPQRGAGHLACIWRTDGNDRIVLHLPMDDVHCIWCEVALRMCSCRNTMPGSSAQRLCRPSWLHGEQFMVPCIRCWDLQEGADLHRATEEEEGGHQSCE